MHDQAILLTLLEEPEDGYMRQEQQWFGQWTEEGLDWQRI